MMLSIAGKTIETNEQGFLANPDEWNEQFTETIAKNDGVAKYVKLGSAKNARIVFPIVEVAKFLAGNVEVDDV